MFATSCGRAAVVLAWLSGFLVGCDPFTGPKQAEPGVSPDTTPKITVRIEASTTSATFVQQESGSMLECSVALTARAGGAEGMTATWESARLMLYGGSDGSDLLRALTLLRESVQATWHSPGIASGQTQQGNMRLLADVPFRVRGEVRYRERDAERRRTAIFETACDAGPVLEGGAEPWIRDIYVEPASDEIEPGPYRILKVTYTAVPRNSGPGLVETGVRVSDGLAGVKRRSEPSAMGRVKATLPFEVSADAAIGRPVRIQVYSIDAEGREVATDWIDGPSVVDHTPPEVVQAYLERVFPFAGQRARLAGRYAASDTMRLSLWGGDNHRVTHVVYTLGPPANVRDSAETRGQEEIAIPIREEWIGARSFSIHLRDAAGLRSPEYASPPDSFQIYPVRPRPTRSGEVAGAFTEVALDPARDRLYLAQPDAQSIAIVPLGDLTAGTRIEFEGRPRPTSLDLAPGGGTLVVALRSQRALALVDPENLTAPPRIVPLTALGEGYGPAAVRYLPSGSVMVQMSGQRHTLFLEYDPATGTQTVRSDTVPFVSDPVASTVRTPDYERIGFHVSEQCAIVYDAVTDRFGACRHLEYGPSISVSDDGSRFAKAFRVYDATLNELGTYHHLYSTYTSGLSPDGRELYLSGRRGLLRVRLEDGAVLERIPLPPVHDGRIAFARDGRLLLAIGREPEINADRTRIDAVDLN